MTIRDLFRWPWTALSFGALAAVMIWQVVLWLTFDPRQPVQFDRTEVLNSPVRPGDTLTVRVYRDKVRGDCPLASDSTAINEDGEVFTLGTYAGPGGAAGRPFVVVLYSIPEDLPDGSYTLRSSAHYECPRGLVFDLVQPVSYFRVQRYPAPIDTSPLGVLPPGLVRPLDPGGVTYVR